ncbi:hypothetical protein J437_LFUL000871 [Ladona fulva]|uniref:Endonuclease/exonuclease/phosphatase domain-containing protein n=1 Tax=Ladona fulva TaxID=123851 RepID=A0A8K0JSW7_LADFU|nr:hypothetical protein J437_LFUL000871 [Ladona fulva]
MFLLDNHFDIVSLSETWLTPSVLDEMIKIDNFNLVRHDRIDQNSSFLKFFCFRSSKLLLCVVYRPPKTGRLDELELELSRFTPTFRNIVIMGDFNSDLLKDTCDSRHIKDLYIVTIFTLCLMVPRWCNGYLSRFMYRG